MSLVYRAEHINLRRTVALKVMADGLARDAASRRRFLREARVAAALDHPNVLPIYEAGEVEGRLYIAMRYLEGMHLGLLIAGGLELHEVASIITQAAAALDAAHARGLVHRDVKPENILIASGKGSDPAGHVYLADFGLTKNLRANSRYTATGQLVGSVHYIAPEVIRARKIDRRCDIYSLGCVLHECLTGAPPYTKESDLAVLWAHVEDDAPSVTDARPEIPVAINDVIAVALAKDPRDRYRSCGELGQDVARLLGSSSRHHAKPVIAQRMRAGDPGAYQAPSGANVPDLYASRRFLGGNRAVRVVVLGTAAVVLAGSALAGIWEQPAPISDRPDGSTVAGTGSQDGQGDTNGVRGGRGEGREGRNGSSASFDSTMGLAPLLPQPTRPLTEVIDAALPANPVPVTYPRPGTYVFRQSGHAHLCQERDGFEVCPGESRVANRQVFELTHAPGIAGRDLILAKSTSDSYATETVTAFGGGNALVTKVTARFSHSNVDFSFSFSAHPSIEMYRFPLSVGNRWRGNWTGRVSGRYVSEVVAEEAVLAGTRRVSALRIDSLTRMSGEISGRVVTSEWIDPITNALVRRVVDLHLRNDVGIYQALISLKLSSGPGY